jgi:hypothetical protein
MPSFPQTIMSTVTAPTASSTSTSQSNFASIFNASLESYKRKTKKDLAEHPLLPSLQSCESPEAVLTVLRDQVPAFNQSRNGDDGLTKWVTPTVNVLYSFSETIGQGVGLVNIKTFRGGNFFLNILFTGIPTSKYNLRRDRRSPFGQSPTTFPCATDFKFDAEHRRLKMRALTKTSLSTSLTALNISSSGLRYILASHRLGL